MKPYGRGRLRRTSRYAGLADRAVVLPDRDGDSNIPPALQDFMARRANAKAVRHVDASTWRSSRPDVTARFMEKAARGSK